MSRISKELSQPQSCRTVLIEKKNSDSNDLKKDIVVYFRTRYMDRPQLLAQPHPEHPDEIACLVSLVPTFVPPQPQDMLDDFEVMEDEKPEELDSLVIPG